MTSWFNGQHINNQLVIEPIEKNPSPRDPEPVSVAPLKLGHIKPGGVRIRGKLLELGDNSLGSGAPSVLNAYDLILVESYPHFRVQEDDCMEPISRITHDVQVMGGKPCIRGMRVTVGMIVGLLAAGYSADDVLEAYPYLERADVQAALSCAAWRSEEVELPLNPL